MIDLVKRFLGGGNGPGEMPAGDSGAHDLRVAVCALFLEMGRIDNAFSREEMDALVGILVERYGLSTEDADQLIAAADRELEDSVDYWRFAKRINAHYTPEEKIEIVETLWRIVYIDDRMDRYEHYLMNKLAALLRLSHPQLIAAKLKVLGEIRSPVPDDRGR